MIPLNAFMIIMVSGLVSISWFDMAFIEPMHHNKPNITYLFFCFYFR